MDEEMKERVSQIVAIFSVVLILVLGFSMYKSNEAFSRNYDENRMEIAKLKGDLADLKKQDVGSKEDLEKNLTEASELGRKVAQYQNKYLRLGQEINDEEFAAMLAESDPYFGDESKFARASWFTMGEFPDGSKQLKPSVMWRFETTYSYAGNKMDVLWTCRNSATGQLYAYTTAVYAQASEAFTDVEVMIVPAGMQFVGTNLDQGLGEAEAQEGDLDTGSKHTEGVDALREQIKKKQSERSGAKVE